MNDYLCITLGTEKVATRAQFLAQGAVVPDLTVKNQPDILRFVTDRLPPARQVDDAEASEAKPDLLSHIHPLIVGPPVLQQAHHALEQAGSPRLYAARIIDTANATHSSALQSLSFLSIFRLTYAFSSFQQVQYRVQYACASRWKRHSAAQYVGGPPLHSAEQAQGLRASAAELRPTPRY